MSTRSTAAHLAEWERETRSSIVFRSATGAMAEDINGKIYLDMTSCSGASPLGSNHATFRTRFARAMERHTDILPSPVSEQRQLLARRISAMFPDTPRAFFLRTGSCATEAAIRIARHRTGKPLILSAGFHGWHDSFQQRPWADETPVVDPHIHDFQYDLDLLARQLADNAGTVAGVFFTPEPSAFPPQLLQDVAAMARSHGALLMVDEVLCGLRYADGGYCRRHAVNADLITIAKGLAQGMGLSAVVGTEDAMRGADRAYLGNTFLRENRAFVAGNLTQDIFEEADVIARIADNGATLKRHVQAGFDSCGVAARVLGNEAMFDVVLPSRAHGRLFAHACLKHGIYAGYPGKYMSNAAMDDAFFAALRPALQRTLEDYRQHADLDAQVTDAAIIDYCAQAFRATAGACLCHRRHWA
ncbi:glutamate-1-semialdehyde aminotransferase [Xanthomonas sacchari]|uniref:aminotransferase class III-fold pyridoxal phosphate-dependent enzyme n=1 Tax=Xanthomonas sacchari TaxID=56458 RepID=UPI0027879016|nr:aminotransferase class III-fold pyridoxal phosphate-dependent enzyme [Xanthomonas sacchari]MDQ1094133.1 glutamate-1-semialdehyde aminotransferase [Xanthomonas sacchari]